MGKYLDVIDILEGHGAELYTILLQMARCQQVAEDLLRELFLQLRVSDKLEQSDDQLDYAKRMAVDIALGWYRFRRKPSLPDIADDPDKGYRRAYDPIYTWTQVAYLAKPDQDKPIPD